MRRTELLIQVQFKVLEIFTDAAIYYLVMTTMWGLVQRRIEAHYGRGAGAPHHSRRIGSPPGGWPPLTRETG